MAHLSKEQVRAGIIGHSIGDALGVPVEFKKRPYFKDHAVTDMIGDGSHRQPLGTWSDDTSMEIATMTALIDCKWINYRAIMSNFLDWWQDDRFTANDVAFDIGYTTQGALENYMSGDGPTECGLKEEENNGNGSLMRILPAAFLCYKYELDIHDTYKFVRDMSSLTHAHPIAIMGCMFYTVFVRCLLNGGSLEDAYYEASRVNYEQFFDEYTRGVYKSVLSGEIVKLAEANIQSDGFVVHTLEAALWCLFNTSDYKSAVLQAVNLGDDTDTVAAVTGSMAGIFYGYKTIPSVWIDKLRKVESLLDLSDEFAKAKIDMGIYKPEAPEEK